MKVLIEIDEKDYERLKVYEKAPFSSLTSRVYEAVANGTPLPKGHGRLIDAGEYVDVLNNAQIEGLNTYKGLGRAKELLIDAPTIIEADKENKNESAD